MEDAATIGSSTAMMAGRMTNATASAMNTAAGNTSGASATGNFCRECGTPKPVQSAVGHVPVELQLKAISARTVGQKSR